MKSYKTLMFTDIIQNSMQENMIVDEDGSTNTWIYFDSRRKDKVRLKAHITKPAMKIMKQSLKDKFWWTGARKIMTSFVEMLMHLNAENTALLSVYVPESYLAKSVRDELEK